jgi:hypothetical protein
MTKKKKLPHNRFLHLLTLRSIDELAECVGCTALADKFPSVFNSFPGSPNAFPLLPKFLFWAIFARKVDTLSSNCLVLETKEPICSSAYLPLP